MKSNQLKKPYNNLTHDTGFKLTSDYVSSLDLLLKITNKSFMRWKFFMD